MAAAGRSAGKVYSYYKNVITLAPNLHITKEEIDLGLSLLDRLLKSTARA